MSNCVGCSGGLGLPEDAIAQHGVQGCDHLAHDGDDDDLGLLARRGEAITEGFESGVVAASPEGGHVEDVTHRHAAAVDAAMSPELAAIEVVWGETDEGGDLLAAHAAELGQQGDEGEGEHRADAWHRGQARVTPREIGIGGDHLGQALVEEPDIGLDPRQAALGEAAQHGVLELGGLVLYFERYFATAGGLISFGADFVDQYRHAAGYVDRILRGEKPADLPVQAPTTYQLIVNVKTARVLGLTVSPALLARADEVIE